MIKKTLKLHLLNFVLALLCINPLTITGCTNLNSQNNNTPYTPADSLDYSKINHNLPVIKIISETGKNDFVEKPKSKVTQNNGWGWGWGEQAPEPYYEKCKITVYKEGGEIDSKLNEVAGQVKVRGNWTTSYDKKTTANKV